MISRRIDCTFRYNLNHGRYNWLRLTPAYSVKLVNEILDDLPYEPSAVLDPFAGTATTPLTCAYRGIPSVSLEINPFLQWMGGIKLRSYSQGYGDELVSRCSSICEQLETNEMRADPPNIFRIDRWWRQDQLDFLRNLKYLIDREDRPARDLLYVAFCKTLISVSGARFDHVSTSFGSNDGYFDYDMGAEIFTNASADVAGGLAPNPAGTSEILLNDSRTIPPHLEFDTVITSPPYPNRISYIRELRPYMYWLDFLHEGAEAGALDWSAIGGTWGCATSRLNDWSPSFYLDLPCLDSCIEQFDSVEAKNSAVMKQYVKKYFYDMYEHLRSLKDSMSGGTIHYIIGNSSFYGMSVPSDELYSEMMSRCGFRSVEAEVVRKRNSKKELFEYCVSASA